MGRKSQNCQKRRCAGRKVHRPPLPAAQLARAGSAAAPAVAAGADRRSTVHLRPLAVWMVAPVAMPTCQEGAGGRWGRVMRDGLGPVPTGNGRRLHCPSQPAACGRQLTAPPAVQPVVPPPTHRFGVLQPEAEAAQHHDQRHRCLGDRKLVADALACAAACGCRGCVGQAKVFVVLPTRCRQAAKPATRLTRPGRHQACIHPPRWQPRAGRQSWAGPLE